MQQNNKEYNIETYNCTTFAVEALEYAGIGGNFMPIREHDWTLPNDMVRQLKNYSALPSYIGSVEASIAIRVSMGNNYGYTPADAAQDLKKAEGEVLLKYGNLDNIRVIENKTYFND